MNKLKLTVISIALFCLIIFVLILVKLGVLNRRAIGFIIFVVLFLSLITLVIRKLVNIRAEQEESKSHENKYSLPMIYKNVNKWLMQMLGGSENILSWNYGKDFKFSIREFIDSDQKVRHIAGIIGVLTGNNQQVIIFYDIDKDRIIGYRDVVTAIDLHNIWQGFSLTDKVPHTHRDYYDRRRSYRPIYGRHELVYPEPTELNIEQGVNTPPQDLVNPE